MTDKDSTISRRQFLGYSALGLAGLTILPSWAQNGVKIAPSDRVVLGFIGLGRQGMSDFRGFAGCPGIQVAACSDVDSMKIKRFQNTVAQWQKSKNMNERCDGYEFFEDLLERKDIDAVEVASPDHWHALMTIYAAQAGKDVYCQKPLSFTIAEAIAMERAIRENKRVLQVGSQQRSSKEFQKAIELVQAGAIGHIDKVYCRVGEPPTPYTLPEQPVPANLNFNAWMGPLNDPKIHYNEDICPVISLDPVQNEKLWGAWRWYQEMGNGYTADWGAHMYDIAQAALGMDGSAPVEYWPKGYNGAQYYGMRYANGVVMTEQPYLDDNENAQGIKFIGDKGWIEVARGYLACSDSSKVPSELAGRRPMTREQMQAAMSAAQRSRQGERNRSQQLQFEISSPHMQNFVDCVRSRQNTIAPVEVGTSTAILCCLCNIARELNRPIKWDPATRSFVNDPQAQANHLYHYNYRTPYKLPYWDC
jgi:predicted dehydrogenase